MALTQEHIEKLDVLFGDHLDSHKVVRGDLVSPDNSASSTNRSFFRRIRYLISDFPHLIRTSLKKIFCNITIVGGNTALTGNINTKNDIHIYGRHEGNIETASQLYIGRDSYTIADIKCRKAIIHGKLYGNIEAEHVKIFSTATVHGNITAISLAVQSGAYLQGNCNCSKMGKNTSSSPIFPRKVFP